MREISLVELDKVSGGFGEEVADQIVVTGTRRNDRDTLFDDPFSAWSNEHLSSFSGPNLSYGGSGGGSAPDSGGGEEETATEEIQDDEERSFDDLSDEQKEEYIEEREKLRQEYLDKIETINNTSSGQRNEPGSSYAHLGSLAAAFGSYRDGIQELNTEFGIEEPIGISESVGVKFTG